LIRSGFYFEEFTQQLPHNLQAHKCVCILAVNSSRWYWIKSLFRGRFRTPPAVRLHGVAGELRTATEREKALWLTRVRSVRLSKGHALVWRDMRMIREIEFNRIEPVRIGQMTLGLW
jgi:hypothetical protein